MCYKGIFVYILSIFMYIIEYLFIARLYEWVIGVVIVRIKINLIYVCMYVCKIEL